MTTFNGLRAGNVARQAEWDTADEKLSLTFKATELAGEVGEACNVVKKMERARLGLKGSHATAADLAEELADVVICADLLAESVGIDLMAAIVAKFNATSEKYGLATRLEPLRVVRHVKRGSTYHVLGEAEGQISIGLDGPGARIAREGDNLTVYRDPSSGRLFWRFPDEFEDGRFEPA